MTFLTRVYALSLLCSQDVTNQYQSAECYMVSSTAATEQSAHRKLDSTMAFQNLHSYNPLKKPYSMSQMSQINLLTLTP